MFENTVKKQYSFRGKEITGAHAVRLLKAIALVREEASDLTEKEAQQLANIAEDYRIESLVSMRPYTNVCGGMGKEDE